jgi:hypothetical protein
MIVALEASFEVNSLVSCLKIDFFFSFFATVDKRLPTGTSDRGLAIRVIKN